MSNSDKKSQHEKRRLAIRRALFNSERSIAALARKIRRPRSTVSQAINHGRFPLVLQKVMREVNVK
jgi:hypothetical protein